MQVEATEFWERDNEPGKSNLGGNQAAYKEVVNATGLKEM